MPVASIPRAPDTPGESDAPRDTVRRIPLTGGAVALIGLDHAGISRKTVIVEKEDATPAEVASLLRWVRLRYPKRR